MHTRLAKLARTVGLNWGVVALGVLTACGGDSTGAGGAGAGADASGTPDGSDVDVADVGAFDVVLPDDTPSEPDADGTSDTLDETDDAEIRSDVGDGTGDVEPDGLQADVDGGVDGDTASGPPPCTLDSDCPDGLCVDLVAGDGGGVCAPPCADDADCDGDADCVLLSGTGSDAVQVCIPLDYCVDRDGDRFGDGPGCLGIDCDDTSAAANFLADERCDGVDNDCDGTIDNAPVEVGDACATGFAGRCASGTLTCEDGIPFCLPAVLPAPEVCDGVDNDCDDAVDNEPIDVGRWYADDDGDGFGDATEVVQSCDAPAGYVAQAGDCDDGSRTVQPLATEVCDGVDNDCDGLIDADDGVTVSVWYVDTDTDGYGADSTAVSACEAPAGTVLQGGDCNDADAGVRPLATELCDGVDNDCDGRTDADDGVLVPLWYADADGDSFGDATVTRTACTAPEGFVSTAGDCDDAVRAVSPLAAEVCDGVDNDCDGLVDLEDGLEATAWYRDADDDGVGAIGEPLSACRAPAGYVAVDGDCDDANEDDYPGAAERCDGRDNDCDGTVDEAEAVNALLWFADFDEDGFGSSDSAIRACGAPAGYVSNDDDCDDETAAISPAGIERCNGVDDDCDTAVDEPDASDVRTWYRDSDRDGAGQSALTLVACAPPEGWVADGGDCDDTVGTTRPGAIEACDGVDNDCDRLIDEDGRTLWYRDADGDGFGDVASSVEACGQPEGYVALATDCDDRSEAVRPGAEERCNGVDDDCDGAVDESSAIDAVAWFPDGDLDGYGTSTGVVVACAAPAGYVAEGGDCDDSRSAVNPAGTETCNGLDDDCDAATDEPDAEDATFWYADADGDRYGNAAVSQRACRAPDGFVADQTDCDDARAATNPGAAESCNSVDDDCDGGIDEGEAIGAGSWYSDADLDGFGNPAAVVRRCTRPAGTVANNTDCNDAVASVNPLAQEVCDGIDNDCNEGVDEDTATGAPRWYADADADTWGSATVSRLACAQPAGFVANNTDCNDANNLVNPGRPEACNGFDDNCNAQVDEGAALGAATWYRDADSDGWGSPTVTLQRCTVPVGYVSNAADCNDGSNAVSPAATEVCNGIDDNCNAVVDEGVTPTWWLDQDGDSWGRTTGGVAQCTAPAANWRTTTGDCNDATRYVRPGATEICDAIDNDCDTDGRVDEGGACPVSCRGTAITRAGVTRGYMYCSDPLRWSLARSSCRAEVVAAANGVPGLVMDLAEMNTTTEIGDIWAAADDNGATPPRGFPRNVDVAYSGGAGWDDAWIGGTDQTIEGRWYWNLDATRWFSTNSTARSGWVTSWKDSEPNNDTDAEKPNGEDCIETEEARESIDGEWRYWNDATCDRTNFYICEWDE